MCRGFSANLSKTLRAFIALLPIMVGMLMLTSLVLSFFPKVIALDLFGHGLLLDTFLGAALGSVGAGHPSASYVLGGELLAAGVELGAVTALIVSWVTVGLVQLPAESLMLGRRFALARNAIALLAAIAIGLLVSLCLRLIA